VIKNYIFFVVLRFKIKTLYWLGKQLYHLSFRLILL
jgi:hypothetical protein